MKVRSERQEGAPRGVADRASAWHATWLAAVLLLPRSAFAQEPGVSGTASSAAAPERSAAQRETARAWVLEGRRSFAAGDYGAALERYRAAYQLVRAPTVGIEVARAQQALGKWVEANATAVEVINLPRSEPEPLVFQQAREAARELLRNLTPRIPALQLEVTPAVGEVQLAIDGEAMPFARGAMPFKLNPGVHQLQLHAPGYHPERLEVMLAEQEYRVLPIALVADLPPAAELPLAAAGADPEQAGSGGRTSGYWALGGAGAAALAGTVTGLLAFSNKPDCPGDVCAAEQRDDADRSRRFGNVATVSFGVALAAAAYGGWELLYAPPDGTASAPASRLRAGLVPRERGAALQLSGAF